MDPNSRVEDVMLAEARAEVNAADQKASLVLAALGVGFGAVVGGLLARDWEPSDLTGFGEVLWWIGAALSLPRLTSKIGIKFALDAILFAAAVKQTVGLEDGASPSVKAVVLGTDFTYRVSKAFDVVAVYNLSYMSIDFGAPVAASMRNHMGTNVSRTDLFHTITFGIAKGF